MSNQQALEAYMAKMEQAKALIAALAEWADDMGNVSPDDVDWSHVGDVTEVVSYLTEAAQFIGVVPAEA